MKKQDEVGLVRKVLKSEITSIVSIVLIVAGFIFWITEPRQDMKDNITAIENDIASIKGNHLTHIQASIGKLEEDSSKNSDEHRKIDVKLERIITLMELRDN